jgi:hypothetical protein
MNELKGEMTMAPTTARATQGNLAPLRPDLQEIVNKVRAMRELTKTTSFQTSRSVGTLLGRLDPDDLANVSLALQQQ